MFMWFVMDKIRAVIRVLLITTITFYFVLFCVGFIIFMDLPWSHCNELDCRMSGRAIGLLSIRAPESGAYFVPGRFYHTRYKIYLNPNISFHLWIPLIYAPLSPMGLFHLYCGNRTLSKSPIPHLTMPHSEQMCIFLLWKVHCGI